MGTYSLLWLICVSLRRCAECEAALDILDQRSTLGRKLDFDLDIPSSQYTTRFAAFGIGARRLCWDRDLSSISHSILTSPHSAGSVWPWSSWKVLLPLLIGI